MQGSEPLGGVMAGGRGGNWTVEGAGRAVGYPARLTGAAPPPPIEATRPPNQIGLGGIGFVPRLKEEKTGLRVRNEARNLVLG